MGVPVITLKGSHYVSRMSTAVLAGAQMFDWIADSPDRLSVHSKRSSAAIVFLRQNRDKWRRSFNNHLWVIPLSLMNALEDSFSAMASTIIEKVLIIRFKLWLSRRASPTGLFCISDRN